MIKLDYTLETPEERKQLVEKILEETTDPSPSYLEILADYLILCMEKQEKRERKIVTENRQTTISKREMSFEGLVSQFENGEDGVYNLMTRDKNIIFQPKVKKITKQEIEEIEPLRNLCQAIELWEAALKRTTGKDAYTIKKALIEMRKDQYVIRNAYNPPINIMKIMRGKYYPTLESDVTFDKDGYCVPHGVSCIDVRICEATLCNYQKLKNAAEGNFESDIWAFMYDFDNLLDKALKDYPMYKRIVEYKIAGYQNEQIQKMLQQEFNTTHTVEYISSLWRNKIPKLIASTAEDEYLDWYYLDQEKGKYKKCSRCGQIKLAHGKYFSKNKTSKDGWYSLCKCCRNKKK